MVLQCHTQFLEEDFNIEDIIDHSNQGLPYLRVTRQSTRRRRVSNLSKGKKEGKEKEG